MTWAQDKLKGLDELIAENRELIEKYPNSFSLKVALDSKLYHREELLKKIENGE